MDYLICRICLVKPGTISVFETQSDNIQYSIKIMRLINSSISENDGLPTMMCDCCTSELSLAYQFVQKCEASDKVLKCLTAPSVLCTDLPNTIDININLNNKPKVDDCNNQDESFINTFPLDNCSKDYFHQDSNLSVSEHINDEQTIKTEQTDTQHFEDTINVTTNNKIKDNRKCKNVKENFSRKKVRRTKSGPMQCVICGLNTSSPSAMEIHMRTHTGEKPFMCTMCDAKYISKGLLKRHIEIFHSTRERKFTCETCGSSFFRKNDIISHLRVHTDERPYVCPYCNKRFRQVASRNRHQSIHSGEKPFSCEICNKKFAYKSLVKKHQIVHTDERKYTCHLCNKSVKSRPALNVHISLHSNEKHNVCSFCGVAFARKGNLTTHIRRIHSEKSGQCSVCLKTCPDLEVHMRKHTGEKPYICGICNASFAVKRSLAHHMIFKHENAGKFKCSITDCTKTFPTATMLEFHLLKQHTNHTPYICQHCPRRFFRTCDLSRHLKASHMDVSFKPIKPFIPKPPMYN